MSSVIKFLDKNTSVFGQFWVTYAYPEDELNFEKIKTILRRMKYPYVDSLTKNELHEIQDWIKTQLNVKGEGGKSFVDECKTYDVVDKLNANFNRK